MGYEIHITRADNWLEAGNYPISQEEIDQIVESDPELQWSTDDYGEMREADGTLKRFYAILWNGEPVYIFYKGEITCKSPNESQVIKAVHIAQALGAKVVGDDGEQYEVTTNASSKEEFVTVDP